MHACVNVMVPKSQILDKQTFNLIKTHHRYKKKKYLANKKSNKHKFNFTQINMPH